MCVEKRFDELFAIKNEPVKDCLQKSPLECDSFSFRIQQNSFKVSGKFLNSTKKYILEMEYDLVFISIYYGKIWFRV